MIIKHLEPDIENILIYDSVIHTGGDNTKNTQRNTKRPSISYIDFLYWNKRRRAKGN